MPGASASRRRRGYDDAAGRSRACAIPTASPSDFSLAYDPRSSVIWSGSPSNITSIAPPFSLRRDAFLSALGYSYNYMKPPLYSIYVAAIFILSGCGTPVWLSHPPSQLAEIAQVDSKSVEVAQHCSFGVVEAKEGKLESYGMFAAFVMTKDAIHLLKGKRNELAMTVERIIPITSIRGVDYRSFGLGRQLQLIHQGRIFFVEFNKGPNLVDREAPEQITRLLINRGVPKWDSVATYFFGGGQSTSGGMALVTGANQTPIKPVDVPNVD